MRYHWWRGTTLFFAGMILLAACSSTTSPSGSASGSTAEQPSASGAGGTKELDAALAGEYSGKVVTAYGPFVDEDEAKFLDMVKVFEDATGIDVQYEGTKQFEQDITIRVDGDNVADIVDFPQPALLATFAKSGKIVDLSPYLSQAYLESQYASSWLDMATMEGPSGTVTAGVWERVNAKSNVWYPKAAFDAAGYQVPTTWDELTALADQIVADGDTPWCIGIESGVATGWPATDWIEDIMLRTTTPENYNAWISGDLKFSSDEVKAAWQTMSDIWLDPEMVYGGKAAIVATAFGDAPAPMFTDPPKCWLHRQGNFITSFFPETAQMGTDYDFFYFPPIDSQYGKPMLVGGDIWAVFSDKPEVLALAEWYTSATHLEPWMATGGALAPQSDVDLSKYGSDVERSVAEVLGEATNILFDASDAMPAAVGTGTFWKEVTAYLNGDVTLDAALQAIDDSWPK